MSYNLYQTQPLKIEYGNLAQNINKEELENSVKNPVERNKLYQLLTGVKNHVEPSMNTLGNVIFGKQDAPTITTNADGTKAVTVNNNRTGGLLGFANDVAKGFGENVSTPYNPNNLLPSKKGFAQRFGEGLGTATRLLDNSAVRGAIAYGLSKSLGDNNALEQGVTAASMNMAAKNNDKLYRNDLENMGVDTNNIGGYITEDMYKNILASRQMQENAEWRKANLLAQQQQNAIMNDIRLQDLAIRKAKLEADLASGSEGKYENPLIILNNVEKLWKKMPQSIAIKGTSKAKAYQTGVANMLGLNNNDVSAYMAIAESMVTPLARQIAEEKGNVSDRDITRARNMLPQPIDSYEQGIAKLNAVRNLLTDLSQKGNNTGKVGTITTNNAQPKTNDLPATPKKIGKYTVEVQ